ncbi:MAG: metal-dependent transcriptional regulator [Thermoanaerobaculia bacterium]
MPTSTVEDYLKCILLEEQRSPETPVTTGHIASELGVAPGTVTSMVKTLADSGLLGYEPYTGVSLTKAGRQLAVHVLRRHRLVELFLVKVKGMDWSEVHLEAERLEHAVSNRLIERMDEMLGKPEVDPHGDPIPTALGKVDEPQLVNLLHSPLKTPLRVARVTDQEPQFLQLVEREGLKPGSFLEVVSRDPAADTLLLRRSSGDPLRLGFRAASKIEVVEETPSRQARTSRRSH